MNSPKQLTVHTQSKYLEIIFDDCTFHLPFEYLRVNSPSAEVRGHRSKPIAPVLRKETVNIERIEPVGHYAIRIFFDDGHNTGLFSWDTLYDLGERYERKDDSNSR